MEKKIPVVKHKNLSSSTEKTCNKCGFSTFYLRVLYKHKYRCKGELLGSLICCYCKRRFNYSVLYKQHKRTCVKFYCKKRKLKNALNKKFANKCKIYGFSKQPTIKCPVCKKCFTEKRLYKKHVSRGSCLQKSKKHYYSARKSFSKPLRKQSKFVNTSDDNYSTNDSISFISGKKKKTHNIFSSNTKSDFICKCCKNVYPSKKILHKHFEKNIQCAELYYQRNTRIPSSARSLSARKSVRRTKRSFSAVARKSFSRIKFNNTEGSARKSFPNSHRKKFKNKISSLANALNQCPVCLESFHDSFEFFQHQKKFNHWGKATKSSSSICKCPFCDKQFFHVRARNAHVRNHADKSKNEIDFFLKNSTCQICSQIFISETAKYQHMKIVHSNTGHDSDFKNDSQSFLSLPSTLKDKLEEFPMKCPVCPKEFVSMNLRDKHFKKSHFNSKLECKFCPLRFNSADNLDSHMEELHYDSFKFECVLCETYLATAPDVVRHTTRMHPNQDPKHIIRSRNKESSSTEITYNFRRTNQKHQNKTTEYYCDVCNISFQKLCGLQSHKMSKSHNDFLKKTLENIDKSVTSSPTSAVPVVKEKTSHPEILICQECQEEFSTVKDFVPHRLSHFGAQAKYMKINENNLYVCEICGDASNSHSKVQMHLFWHLQVESTSTPSTAKAVSESTMPDKSNGQPVAKKSFSKSPESQQVVIGGVKKSLFTCEFCNVGFTTEAHYSLHVRKFCRMKSVNKSDDDASIGLPSIDSLVKSLGSSNTRKIEHCPVCNCFISASLNEEHKSVCWKVPQITSTLKEKNEIELKMTTNGSSIVAACITCNISFDSSEIYMDHMIEHKSSENNSMNQVDSESESANSTVHCTSCNCLFFNSRVLENHKNFCSNSTYCDFDSESVADILKAAKKLENPVAACIMCSVMFQNAQCLNEHMLIHQNKITPLPSKSASPLHDLDAGASGEEVPKISLDFPTTNDVSSKELIDNLLQNKLEVENGEGKDDECLPAEELCAIAQIDGIAETVKVSDAKKPNDQNHDTMDNPIIQLRENFSQLLCILISDTDLMAQLGYGEQSIDDVLVNVLQQMGHSPILKESECLEIDCLRKNIQMLLDVCLKDQIMELIGEGQTSTDDIVVEALKMFSNESINAAVD